MIDLRAWSVTEQVKKTVNADGSYSIVTEHFTDTRFRLPSERPKRTIINQIGIQVVDQTDTLLLNMPFNGATLSHVSCFGNEGATMLSTGARMTLADASIAALPAPATTS